MHTTVTELLIRNLSILALKKRRKGIIIMSKVRDIILPETSRNACCFEISSTICFQQLLSLCFFQVLNTLVH
jgi:hypothetical protein